MRIDDAPVRPSSSAHASLLRLTPKQCMAAAVLVFAVLVVIGAVPGYARTLSNATDDKLLHFVAFSFLSVLIFNGVTGIVLGRALGTLLIIALFGAIDEAIQSFMPYRTASILDWYVDMLAGLICVSLLVARELVRVVASKREAPPDL